MTSCCVTVVLVPVVPDTGEAVRRHWHVEKGLRWVLDLSFRGDERRVRLGHRIWNLAVLRRLA
jgi:predicted transposase YbfD/YdcC